jgi:hypothetical protein
VLGDRAPHCYLKDRIERLDVAILSKDLDPLAPSSHEISTL